MLQSNNKQKLKTMENNTEKQLVEFGKYLLSDERKNRIASGYSSEDNISLDERLKEVYDADISNFYEANPDLILKNKEFIGESKYDNFWPYMSKLEKMNYMINQILIMSGDGFNRLELDGELDLIINKELGKPNGYKLIITLS